MSGRRRRSGAATIGRARRWLSTVLVLAGLALAGDVVLTLLWEEPVSAVLASVRRLHIDERWAHGMALGAVDRAELAAISSLDGRIAYLAAAERHSVPDGAALGTLEIAAIGLHDQLIQGTTGASLALGPGHYRDSDLPGEGGTVAIAGHRTTYLAPFRDINRLASGDEIVLWMPYGSFSYVVQRVVIVAPDAWWITRDVGYDRLVLSSCNPLFSATQRIVVFARLSSVTPAAVARHGRPHMAVRSSESVLWDQSLER